jgi:hypothetical protein
MNRRRFVRSSAILAAGAALPLAARAQAQLGTVRELRGRVLLNGRPMGRNHAIQPGQTITTGSDGHVWFTLGGDAFFLRPGSDLRLSPSLGDTVLDTLRLVSGALGAAFGPGAPRRLLADTVTIGIRGTGVYVEATSTATYVCTCFGTTDLTSLALADAATVTAKHHAARWITRSDNSIREAEMREHSDEEMSRLEALAGRPNPF